MKTFTRRGTRPLLWLVLLLCCAGESALAATLTVTQTGDSGPGSLRQVMLDAMASPGASTIEFVPAIGAITLASPLPELLESGGDLTISGNGASATIIDGGGLYRPFKLAWQANVRFTLRNLTLRNGFADQEQGGAIYFVGSASSNLTIESVEFVGNRATWEGGAIYTGLDATIRDSLFDSNVAGTGGGAINENGGGLTVSNSTFVNNSGTSILEVDSAGSARLVNTTLTGNAPNLLATVASLNQSELSISNSIVAGNPGFPDVATDHGGLIVVVTSLNNVIGNAGNSGIVDGANGNTVGAMPPLLGPLADHGGSTRTVALLPGSPALNAGTANGGDIPASDARGIARVGTADVGAFESRGFSLAPASGGGQSTGVNTPFADPLVAQVSANDSGEPVAGGQLVFAGPATGPGAVLTPSGATIDANGLAQVVATANASAGGPYTVVATLANGDAPLPDADYSLTNVGGTCGAFTFPYTLAGTDNTARVAELRQAIECANANTTDDEIDLAGNTLVFTDGPSSNANGVNALPFVTSTLTLANGALERNASAPPFRFLDVAASGNLGLRAMQLRNGLSQMDGGAIRADGELTTEDSVFEDNVAATLGGALSSHVMTNIATSRFTRNVAPDGAAIAGGDGDAIPGGDVTLVISSRFEDNGDGTSRSVIWNKSYFGMIGSLVADNQLSAVGSSLMFFHDDTAVAELRSVTIAGNSVQGALFSWALSNVQLHNVIIWDNQYGSLGNVSPTHSILPGVPAVNGNLDQPPGFVGPGDYRLDAGSPAIDAGDNSYGWPVGDLDGNPRPLDDTGVVDTGNGSAPITDIGAYEYQTDSAVAGITVTPTSGLITTETGGTATFTVVLDRYPKADVSLTLSSSDPTEGVVFPTSLSLTQANWNQPQTITVIGLDDGVIDGDQAYTIVIGSASSADADYAGIDPPDVSVVNEETAIPPHHVGGTVIGLLGNGLVLSLGAGAESLPITANGSFAFTTALASGAAYAVTIANQPQAPAQTCVVINSSGTMGSVDIGNIVVNCGASNTYAVGGTLSGLVGGGLVLQLNGGGDLSLSANGSYTFLPRLVDAATYVVTVRTQPQGQLCTLSHASGTVMGADITNVDVSCSPLQANLQLSVDDGHEFARYGHVRDYFVSLDNTGNIAANDVEIAATFSAAFDVTNVHWQCLGGVANCSVLGSGGFSDTANVPANSSLTWVVSVPVLADSNEADATFTIGQPMPMQAPAGVGLVDAADTDTLVIFRDGVDVPYGDGTQALDEVQQLSLSNEANLSIEWLPASAEGVRSVRVLAMAEGTVEVQGLTWRGMDFVRLLGTDARDQQQASAWSSVAAAAQLVVGRVDSAGHAATVLLEGAAQPLALSLGARDNNGEIE